MAAKKSSKPKKDLSSRQHAFLKAYAKGKTLKHAAIEAGYSKKNADQSGYQALKAIKGRVADLMDEIGLTDRALIENYLVPLLEAKETKFVHDRGRLKEKTVQALGIRHAALDTAFKLRGSYAPRDPKEAEQFGVKVIRERGPVPDWAKPILEGIAKRLGRTTTENRMAWSRWMRAKKGGLHSKRQAHRQISERLAAVAPAQEPARYRSLKDELTRVSFLFSSTAFRASMRLLFAASPAVRTRRLTCRSLNGKQAGKMAGWEAHAARPLPGPLSARGPEPTVHHPKEVNDGPPWPDGHIQEVRVFSTDVLGQPPIFLTKERERFQLSPLFL